jgi:hypothetical protein
MQVKPVVGSSRTQGLGDLYRALICWSIAGLVPAAAARAREDTFPSAPGTEQGALMASARVEASVEGYHRTFRNLGVNGSAVAELVTSLAEDFDRLSTVVKNDGTKTAAANLDAIRQSAEAAFAASLAAYGNAPQTATLRAHMLAEIGKILRIVVDAEPEGRRKPTDEEICNIINQTYPTRMPGIAEAEKTLRQLVREQYLPASNEQLRRALDLPEYKQKRRRQGRPPKSK